MPSEKEIEAAMSAWSRALADAPDESVYERRRRCIHAALSAAARVREEDNAREPTMSVEAPERIWIESEGGCPYFYHEEELPDVDSPVTEYVRADKLEELLKKQEELTTQLLALRKWRQEYVGKLTIVEAQLAELSAENEQLKEAMEMIAHPDLSHLGMITKDQVIEQFGFDPETVGLRHCGWWIVEAVEGEEEIANAEVGHLCVSTLDGGDNPIDENAFKVGDFVGTATDRFGCTYRYYYYRPLDSRDGRR